MVRHLYHFAIISVKTKNMAWRTALVWWYCGRTNPGRPGEVLPPDLHLVQTSGL